MCKTVQFENHISVEAAYRLICLYNGDEGGRDAISARGWLKYSSWLHDSRMYLSDGSYIIREPFVDGHLIHSNITVDDILEMFSVGKSAQAYALAVEHNEPVMFISKWTAPHEGQAEYRMNRNWMGDK